MKGFIECNTISRNLYAHDNQYFYNKHGDFDKYIRWDMLRKAGINPYPELNIYDAGYELVIGPAVPETDGKMHGIGIYCKNWQEIINKSNLNIQKSIRYM